MNDVVSRVVTILIDRFKLKGIESFVLNEELDIVDPVSERKLTSEEREYAKQQLLLEIKFKESHDGAVLIPVSIVEDPKEHDEWYPEWYRENNNTIKSYYWKRLERFLSSEFIIKHGPLPAGKIIKSVDEATYKIMERLANPKRGEFTYKGLVIGYVQSGKTQNFTALIAKAADAGYKFIIVLAGIHNVLRLQTQVRLDRELTGEKDIETDDKYIPSPGAAKKWNRLTTANNDFSTINLSPFSTYCILETPTLAIVKKNVSVLKSLIAYVSRANEEDRSRVPVLIIDDEADQASIDTNANADSDPSRINECIRSLLLLFSRKTYVGYTATPFANVLLNMSNDHDDLKDDLYPRNFIISLPEPEGYFGTSKIFQSTLSDKKYHK